MSPMSQGLNFDRFPFFKILWGTSGSRVSMWSLLQRLSSSFCKKSYFFRRICLYFLPLMMLMMMMMLMMVHSSEHMYSPIRLPSHDTNFFHSPHLFHRWDTLHRRQPCADHSWPGLAARPAPPPTPAHPICSTSKTQNSSLTQRWNAFSRSVLPPLLSVRGTFRQGGECQRSARRCW